MKYIDNNITTSSALNNPGNMSDVYEYSVFLLPIYREHFNICFPFAQLQK